MLIALAKLIRLPLVFTAVADSLAGYLLSSPFEVEFSKIIGLVFASACLYSAGMLFNDVVDLEKDRKWHPTRSLPSGAVSLQMAVVFGGILIILGLLLGYMVRFHTFVVAFIVVILIFSYNGIFKGNRVLGSLNMGLLRFANFALGISVNCGLNIMDRVEFPFLLFIYVSLLTMISTLEEGESRKELFILMGGLLAIDVLAINIFIERQVVGLLVSLVLIGLLINQMVRSLKVFSRESVKEMVKMLVVGIIPFDAVMLLGDGEYTAGFCVLLLLLPSFLLQRIVKLEA